MIAASSPLVLWAPSSQLFTSPTCRVSERGFVVADTKHAGSSHGGPGSSTNKTAATPTGGRELTGTTLLTMSLLRSSLVSGLDHAVM